MATTASADVIEVKVLLFAALKEKLGGSVKLTVPRGSTVSAVLDGVAALAGSSVSHCTIALDEEYVDKATTLDKPCEVAVIPPVSGG